MRAKWIFQSKTRNGWKILPIHEEEKHKGRQMKNVLLIGDARQALSDLKTTYIAGLRGVRSRSHVAKVRPVECAPTLDAPEDSDEVGQAKDEVVVFYPVGGEHVGKVDHLEHDLGRVPFGGTGPARDEVRVVGEEQWRGDEEEQSLAFEPVLERFESGEEARNDPLVRGRVGEDFEHWNKWNHFKVPVDWIVGWLNEL